MTDDILTPQLACFSTEIIMNSSIIRFLAVALSLFVAQAVTQIGNDSHLRGRGQTQSLESFLRIENGSHLRGNNHAPMASVIQIENYSHLRGGSRLPTSISPQSHNSSPHIRMRDTNSTIGTNSRLRRTEL
jgi:hypothetical protein